MEHGPAKNIAMNLLYDFYGQLLTPRQRDIFILYYHQDLSLGEIAEHLDISRQGVHDLLRRGQKTLLDLEQSLGLVAKYRRQRELVAQLADRLDQLAQELKEPELAQIGQGLMELMEE
ncbi:MAG: YlxM family DNA-binding protein [Limnochordia bacterium]|jgi:predicted DNA-binding protein YlxM (UPF0122 family)